MPATPTDSVGPNRNDSTAEVLRNGRRVLTHDPATRAEVTADGTVTWTSRCNCGWSSPPSAYEVDADIAGLGHEDEHAVWPPPNADYTADALLAGIARHRATLEPGLTDAELGRLHELGIDFAPDHAHLLSRTLPTGPSWPAWRTAPAEELRALVNRPAEDLVEAAADGRLSLPTWGAAPGTVRGRRAAAVELLRDAPRLVPLYGKRYLPARPEIPGNPVLSVYEDDVIVFAEDLGEWVHKEFDRTERHRKCGPARYVELWSDVAGYRPHEDETDLR